MPLKKLNLFGYLSVCVFVLPWIKCSAIETVSSGICATQHRVQRTRYVSYHETYRSRIFWITRIKTRTNYRIEHYEDWESTSICCNGYELDLFHKKCISKCQGGCTNGVCTGRNTCTCNAGYLRFSNNITGWDECLPQCFTNCSNGRCIAPNVCDCDPGFVAADDRASCQPSCTSIGHGGSRGCGNNASCIAPNVCICDTGYEAFNKAVITNNSTLPVMEAESSDTTSGPTTSPTLPTTNFAVFANDDYICRPLCSQSCSQNASCVAPDICECDPGYSVEVLPHHSTNRSRRCLPVCEKNCVNAFCSYPNRCTCEEGYKPATNDSTVCEPICHDECVNSVCTLPDHCKCMDGYEKSSHLKHPEHVCTPICSGGCLNGKCISPGTCVCNEGYIFTYEETNNTKSLTCRPHCRPECLIGSSCIAPDQCQLQLPATYVDDYCNSNGVLSRENGTCFCNYGWTGMKCNEAKSCGIFFTFGNESNYQFLPAERVYYPRNWDWNGSTCNQECEHLILSLKLAGNTSTIAVHCYHLELLEKTAGLVSKEILLSQVFNESHSMVFCSIPADSSCNLVKSNAVSIIFGSLSFFLIMGCAIISYNIWHRLRKIPLRAIPKANDDLTEPLRVMGTLDREEAAIF